MSETRRDQAAPWLLLITNLPGKNQTLRMRLWRALKFAGAGLLKDGVYVLPNSSSSRRLFEGHAKDITSGGGSGHVLAAGADSPEQLATFQALFDRTADYGDALKRLNELKRKFAKHSETTARQKLAALRREITALIERDFFPGKSREQTEGALADAEAALNAHFSPDEPHAAQKDIKRRERKEYRGRVWATREKLWIDRVASAWLIRRFVDPDAKFVWLKSLKDRPKKALGFDFDGADFTHVGAKVTFEVILTSFELEPDPGLTRIGVLVHYLDVGGIPVPEAAGFASIMAGARSLQPDDDALLQVMTPVLDSLHAAYSNASED